MDNSNIYDKRFSKLDDSRQVQEEIRAKLAEGLKELNDLKRMTTNKQAECSIVESEVLQMKLKNQKIKESLMTSLIEKDELFTKKNDLIIQIDQLKQQIENLNKESNILLNDESIERICQRYSTSNQQALLNKIHEAKCKLLKFQK